MLKDQKLHWFSFVFICFDSIQIFEEFASLSFKVSWAHQFWTDFKKKLDFVFFPLGLSNFVWAAWFPFDKGQSIIQLSHKKINCIKMQWVDNNQNENCNAMLHPFHFSSVQMKDVNSAMMESLHLRHNAQETEAWSGRNFTFQSFLLPYRRDICIRALE